MSADLLATWFAQFSAHRLALAHDQTRYQYGLNIRRFGEFLGRDPTLADLRDENVMGCVGWLVREKKLSLASASKLRDNIKTLWEYIARKGGIRVWPELPHIQEPENAPVALNVRQLTLLWRIAERQPGSTCGVPDQLWWTSLLGTMWSSGERIEPFKQATWAEFDLDGGFWIVPAAHRKGGKRGIVHPLHHGAVMLLRQLHGYGHEQVWPMDFCCGTLYNRLTSIMVCAGLPDDRRFKFHVFRKSVATMIELFGGDTTGAIGWRDPTQKDAYVDRTICPRVGPRNYVPFIGDLRPDERLTG